MTDSLDAWLDGEGAAYVAGLRSTRERVAEPKAKKRGNPERDAQRAVVAWLRKAGCIVQATFTEQAAAEKDAVKRARFGAARKASGATTGFPDLTVVTPQGRLFFIEMKAAKGRLSEAQAAMRAELRARGCVVILGRDIWSVESAMAEVGIVLTHPGLRAPLPAERIR